MHGIGQHFHDSLPKPAITNIASIDDGVVTECQLAIRCKPDVHFDGVDAKRQRLDEAGQGVPVLRCKDTPVALDFYHEVIPCVG
jgi:hypothetical protein